MSFWSLAAVHLNPHRYGEPGSPPPALSLVHQDFIAAQHHLPRNKWCFASSRLSCLSAFAFVYLVFPSTFLQIILVKKEASRHFSGSSRVPWQRVVNNKCFWALSLFYVFVSWNLSQSVFVCVWVHWGEPVKWRKLNNTLNCQICCVICFYNVHILNRIVKMSNKEVYHVR